MELSRGSKIFLVLLIFAVAGGYGAFQRWQENLEGQETEVEAGHEVTVEIPEGSSASAIAQLLEDEGVIGSSLRFQAAASNDERAAQLRPGEYDLVTGMSNDEILEALSAEPESAETFAVTIPEGLRLDQTLEVLEESGPYSVEEYEEALEDVELPEWVPDEIPEGGSPYEGLLFPDTYEIREENEPAEVLGLLVEHTEQMMEGLDPPEEYSTYDMLIVASMIEREARVADERPVIASVIYNRLAEPMRLQVDATVQYAQGEHRERLLYEDLEIDSEWNTYEADGLPPTPISAAGRSALEAAADPASTDYLYYVVNDIDAGTHAFAATHEEHEQNRQEYFQMRDEAEAEEPAEDAQEEAPDGAAAAGENTEEGAPEEGGQEGGLEEGEPDEGGGG